MESVVISKEDEVTILKKKCNALLDMIDTLKSDINDKAIVKKIVEPSEKNINNECSELMTITKSFEGSDELQAFIISLESVIKKALQEHAFIEYAYSSKYSAEYCKIEKNIFNSYIEELSNIDNKKFNEYCIDFLYLKAEHNKKCVYTSDKKQIYYIRRSIVKLLGAELYDQQSR